MSAVRQPNGASLAATRLFEPLHMRGVTFKNRIVCSPMCMYRAEHDGMANDWHFAHYSRLAMGGAAMVMLEATAVDIMGRHCYADLGIWGDEHVAPLRRITDFMKGQQCLPALQLQHAGRKGGTRRPWHGKSPLNDEDIRLRGEPPWPVVGPSALPASDGMPLPSELAAVDIPKVIDKWVVATRRAVAAGFEVLELHAAHGYLVHQFLSAYSNKRTDRYGGDRNGRMRFALELVEAVRRVWPEDKPLLMRVSAVDEAGWSLDDTVALAREFKARGVDAIDCSSGGIAGSPTNQAARRPGFQVPFAERVRADAGIPTVAVGLIMTPQLAAEIVDNGLADLVAIGREVLVNPNWPCAARTLLEPDRGHTDWPPETGWWLDRRADILAAAGFGA